MDIHPTTTILGVPQELFKAGHEHMLIGDSSNSECVLVESSPEHDQAARLYPKIIDPVPTSLLPSPPFLEAPNNVSDSSDLSTRSFTSNHRLNTPKLVHKDSHTQRLKSYATQSFAAEKTKIQMHRAHRSLQKSLHSAENTLLGVTLRGTATSPIIIESDDEDEFLSDASQIVDLLPTPVTTNCAIRDLSTDAIFPPVSINEAASNTVGDADTPENSQSPQCSNVQRLHHATYRPISPAPSASMKIKVNHDFKTSKVPLINAPIEMIDLSSDMKLCPGSLSESFKPAPRNTTSCRERKRVLVEMHRPPKLTKDMHQWVTDTNRQLDPFRKDDECWFHPSPPPGYVTPSGVLRPSGTITKEFQWQNRKGRQTLFVNFGIICKLVFHTMTKLQKDGFVNKQWHLSHLCGNWTCINPDHTTVEPGSVNLSRNNCFSHRAGCLHAPECMKDKKVPLGADGKSVNHNIPAWKAPHVADYDDWEAHHMGDDSQKTDAPDETDGVAMESEEISHVCIEGVKFQSKIF